MAGITAELEVDYSSALSGAADLGSTLDEQFAQVAENLSQQISDALATVSQVPIEADTSAIAGEIEDAAAVDVPPVVVDADTSAAEDTLSSFNAVVEAEHPVVSVDADTADADAAISDLGGSAATARGDVGGLALDAGLLGTAMGAARGNVAGTAESLSAGLGPLTAFGGGILALGTATAGFVEVGEKAHAATERLNLIFGDAAPKAMAVNIGGLNGDLNELAIKAGSSGAQLRQATASLGQVAIAAGLTQDQAAGLVGQFQALALRAVAMNPNLGEAGDVMGRLTTALARGGRFAQQYGISLSAAEISARALSDTGKTTATDLTVLEKATAGAEIATERLGTSLGTDFARGADQAQVKFKALKAELIAGFAAIGTPLVEPILQLAEAFTPLAVAIGQAVGKLVTGMLPAVQGLLPIIKPLADIIGLLGDVLGALGDVLPAATFGFIAYEAVTNLLPIALGGVTTAALLLTDALPLTAVAAETAAAGIATAEETIAASLGPVGLLVAGLGIAATAFGLFGDSGHDAETQVKNLTSAMAKLNGQALTTSFDQFANGVRLASDGISQTTARLRAFRVVADDNVGVAQRTLDALKAQGASTAGYQAILDKAVASQKNQKAAQDETDAATQQLTGDTTAQAKAQDDLTQKVDAYVSSVTGGFPSVSSTFDTATQSAQNYGLALSPEFLLSQLQQSLTDTLNFTRNIKIIFDAGFTDIGALLSEKGAAAGGGIAQSLAGGIATGSPEIAKQLNDQAQAVNVAGAIAAQNATAQGQAVVANTNTEYSKMAPALARLLGLTADQFTSAGPEIAAQAAAAASFGYTAFASGVAPIPGSAGQAVTDSGGAMTTAGGAVGATGGLAYNAGFGVGQAFTVGLVIGMDTLLGDVIGEAAHLVDEAEKSARRAARSDSPSQLFADLGRDLSLGLAQGMQATAKTVVVPASREVIQHAAAQAPAGGSGGHGALIGTQTNVFNAPVPNPVEATRTMAKSAQRAIALAGW